MPVTTNASKDGSGNSQPISPNLLKSPQVAGYLLARLLTHPPQAPERCRANLLYCETQKLEMRNTAQIWWAQDSRRGGKRCCSVAFSSQASESGSLLFRTKKAMTMWHASRSRLLHLPNHCNGTKAPRKGYLPPWASYSPASLRYSCRKWATRKSLATPLPHRPLDTYPDLR